MKKKHKKLKITIGIIVVLLLIVNCGIVWYFFQEASVRNNKPITMLTKSSPNYALQEDFQKLPKSTVYITNDNLKLDAWYVPADKPTTKTVIVDHGFRQGKQNMEQYGELFHQLGYNVLMPDNRGAGDSQGKYITYGYQDKYDITKWAQYLVNEKGATAITLYGLSLGGATVMMASDLPQLPKQVNSIIEDCGYDNIWNEITYQAKQMYNIPPFPLVYEVSAYNKLVVGNTFNQGSSTAALAKDTRPILLIQGTKDTYVPYSMLAVNYAAVKQGTPKEKLAVKGAIHAHSFETDPSLYRKTVAAFMAKYNPLTN